MAERGEDLRVLRQAYTTAVTQLEQACRATDRAFSAWELAQVRGLTAQLNGCWNTYTDRLRDETKARAASDRCAVAYRAALPALVDGVKEAEAA